MKALIAVAVSCLLLPGVADASDLYTDQYRQCMATADSMVDKGNCEADEITRQNALADAEYKIALESAPAKAKAALTKAQQAWRVYRDLDCNAKKIAVDGSGAGEAYGSCMLQHARVRRLQLQHFWEM